MTKLDPREAREHAVVIDLSTRRDADDHARPTAHASALEEQSEKRAGSRSEQSEKRAASPKEQSEKRAASNANANAHKEHSDPHTKHLKTTTPAWTPSQRLPPNIFDLDAGEGARAVILRAAFKARRAADKLEKGTDPEALRKFRVSLRKLRSALKTWSTELDDTVSKKSRRVFAKLQRTTGEGRDAQVGMTWLAQQTPRLEKSERVGALWLSNELSRIANRFTADRSKQMRERFYDAVAKLETNVAVVRKEYNLLDTTRPPTFALALANAIERHAEMIVVGVDRAAADFNVENAHAVRIAAKRFRYLLAPHRRYFPEARALANRCKQLQDLLGRYTDASVVTEAIDDAVRTSAKQRLSRIEAHIEQAQFEDAKFEASSNEWPGLVTLRERIAREKRIYFVAFRRDWSAAQVDALRAQALALATTLRDHSG